MNVEHEDVHLPPPTPWPAALAGGVALAGLGVLTSYAFCAAGGALVGLALVRWIGEMRRG